MSAEQEREVALGDVATFVRGITFKPTDVVPLGSPGSITCMRTKNVQSALDDSDLWSIPERLASHAKRLEVGDILISSANSLNLVGKCCWVPELARPATFGGFVTVLRSDAERLDARYLYWWFSSQPIQAKLRALSSQTTNIANLSVERCRRLRLPLPSPDQQRRIAELLDRADALRAKRREALARLDTLSRSIFLDMFGEALQWPSKPLGALVEEFRYGTSVKSQGHGRPALRIPNIVGGTIDFRDLKLVPLTSSEFERLRLASGDVLFVRTNGNPDYVGRCAVFNADDAAATGFDPDEFAFASYLIRGRLRRSELAPTYVREFLRSRDGRRALRSRCKTSAGQYNVNTEGLGSIPVPVPPLTLQEDFTLRIRAVDKAATSHQRSLTQLDALFASLQHRAFRGEL